MPISIDFESRSTIDLQATNVYRYAMDPATDVLVVAWSRDQGETTDWCDPRRGCPDEIVEAVATGDVFQTFNASFERVMWERVLRRYGWPVPALEQFDCTMARASQFGIGGTLDDVATVLGLKIGKDLEGKRLMLKMCRPIGVHVNDVVVQWKDCSPALQARAGANPSMLVWHEKPEQIERLAAYCCQDVVVEAQVARRVPPLPDDEAELYRIDQRINDRGVHVNVDLVDKLIDIAAQAEKRINAALRDATNGRVGSAKDHRNLLTWLQANGVDATSVDKETIKHMLHTEDLGSDVEIALHLRQEGSKVSTAKLKKLKDGLSEGDRLRGALKFCGAARTRRWASLGVQIHNLPRDYVNPDEVFG